MLHNMVFITGEPGNRIEMQREAKYAHNDLEIEQLVWFHDETRHKILKTQARTKRNENGTLTVFKRR